jgi:two-component system response regulator AtoC
MRMRATGYHAGVRDQPARVLVIDDEENLRHMLTLVLGRAGYAVRATASASEALGMLRDTDIVLCDLRMPGMDGMAFLDARPPDSPPVIVMSAYGSNAHALEAVRRGAYDFVAKPFGAEEIVLLLRKLEEREALAAERSRLAIENARLGERTGEPVEGFVGRSPPVRELTRILARAAPTDTTVLVTGESGTGKELIARALHRMSPRAGGPWVAVNCAAIPDTLLEAEWFGHVRGAFTGAVAARAGLFEQADGGTLFLDEIGEIPSGLQAKLLRAIEERAIRRIGATRDTPVDVRIVAASSRPLAPPAFREDLYYRLAVIHLHLPPLRARPEDIPLLVEHLLDACSARLRLPRPQVHPDALRRLLDAPWPGNVRQLENALERALLLSDGAVIRPDDLPADLHGRVHGPRDADDLSIPRQSAALERALIVRALGRTDGNKAAAARLLEISYKALLYKIRDYGIGDDATEGGTP